jgi:hypothetical protein
MNEHVCFEVWYFVANFKILLFFLLKENDQIIIIIIIILNFFNSKKIQYRNSGEFSPKRRKFNQILHSKKIPLINFLFEKKLSSSLNLSLPLPINIKCEIKIH